tara:strand:- start:1670 stop:2293 length:624 start_codon:yes stop_codon:yes gene_type:complete
VKPIPRPAEPGEFLPENYFRRLSLSELFTREAPLEVDLGSGDGSFALAMARQFPDRNFLAVERLLGRVRKTCKRATEARLPNLRVLRLEARYTVEWLLPHASVSRLHLLFPDPWPKVRHHRRRLINAEFLGALSKVLVPAGDFLFKTDHEDYFEWATDKLSLSKYFQSIAWDDQCGELSQYPQTDFEAQWLAEGRSVHKLRARNVST